MNQILFQRIFNTPIGLLQGIASNNGLCALEFVKPDREKLLQARLNKWFPTASIGSRHHPTLELVELWINTYFAREFVQLPALPIDPRGTDFEMTVWKEMRCLVPGQTITYAALARKLGRPNASRAVGNASRRNSIAIIIPCHRVVGSNGNLTGYGGGLEQKQWLLNHEQTARTSLGHAMQTEFAWT